MTFIRRVLIVAAAIPAVGCFEATTVIKLKADGSGTIQQRLLLTDAAMDQLRAFAILGGGDAANADPTSEAQARSLAETLGPGVSYVSSAPVKTATAQGRESVYAFADITKIHVSEQPRLPTGPISPAGGSNVGEVTFTLTRQPDGNVVLRMQVPRPDLLPIPTAGPNGDVTPPSAQQIEMLKALLSGAHLAVTIEPEGQLVQTSSSFVDGNRVTLVEFDVNTIASDPGLVTKLQSAKTPDEIKAAINSVPGLKLPLDPEISITFTPATPR